VLVLAVLGALQAVVPGDAVEDGLDLADDFVGQVAVFAAQVGPEGWQLSLWQPADGDPEVRRRDAEDPADGPQGVGLGLGDAALLQAEHGVDIDVGGAGDCPGR
jgi:hypothetical protein